MIEEVGPGSASRHFMPRRVRDTRKSACAKNRISQIRSSLSLLSTPSRKNIQLSPTGKSSLEARPTRAHPEGRIAIVTDVGCGVRWTRSVARRATPSRTAKSCGPDASTLASPALMLRRHAESGDNKARSPGRARHRPLKPFACGNAGMTWRTRGDLLVCFFYLHARLRVRLGARHSPRP